MQLYGEQKRHISDCSWWLKYINKIYVYTKPNAVFANGVTQTIRNLAVESNEPWNGHRIDGISHKPSKNAADYREYCNDCIWINNHTISPAIWTQQTAEIEKPKPLMHFASFDSQNGSVLYHQYITWGEFNANHFDENNKQSHSSIIE